MDIDVDHDLFKLLFTEEDESAGDGGSSNQRSPCSNLLVNDGTQHLLSRHQHHARESIGSRVSNVFDDKHWNDRAFQIPIGNLAQMTGLHADVCAITLPASAMRVALARVRVFSSGECWAFRTATASLAWR